MTILIDKLKGVWTSVEKVEVLDYESNFSNWIGQMPESGIFRFEVSEEEAQNYHCQLKIPISNTGYYTRYSGRFANQGNKILIWQNENVPVEIPYKWQGNLLELKLFKRKILFEKTSN